MNKSYQEHFDQSCSLRENFWKQIGDLHTDVLSHLINPAFLGGAEWPSFRQAFLTVKAGENTIIASDGLSDPFEEADDTGNESDVNGFGLEFYVETPDKVGNVKESWQFDLVYQMSQFAASHGNIEGVLEQYNGLLTTELYNVRVPADFINNEERVGVFLGLEGGAVKGKLALSLSEIKLVNIKLLTLAELEYAAQNGPEGRTRLAQLFKEQGNPTFSSLDRPSVI
jgi:hypothetical protein